MRCSGSSAGCSPRPESGELLGGSRVADSPGSEAVLTIIAVVVLLLGVLLGVLLVAAHVGESLTSSAPTAPTRSKSTYIPGSGISPWGNVGVRWWSAVADGVAGAWQTVNCPESDNGQLRQQEAQTETWLAASAAGRRIVSPLRPLVRSPTRWRSTGLLGRLREPETRPGRAWMASIGPVFAGVFARSRDSAFRPRKIRAAISERRSPAQNASTTMARSRRWRAAAANRRLPAPAAAAGSGCAHDTAADSARPAGGRFPRSASLTTGSLDGVKLAGGPVTGGDSGCRHAHGRRPRRLGPLGQGRLRSRPVLGTIIGRRIRARPPAPLTSVRMRPGPETARRKGPTMTCPPTRAADALTTAVLLAAVPGRRDAADARYHAAVGEVNFWWSTIR